MFCYELDEKLILSLKKIAKRNSLLYEKIFKKVKHITENPYSGKPLRNILKNKRRVHIGHLVLLYEIDEKEHKIIFFNLDHHDNIYR